MQVFETFVDHVQMSLIEIATKKALQINEGLYLCLFLF